MTPQHDPGRNPTGGSPTGVPSRLVKGSAAVRLRDARAVRLRLEGLTYREVGEQLGIGRKMAARVVQRGLNAVARESAAELIALDNERLDMLWRAMWPKAEAGSAPHAMVCLKALERRARLLGLDAPSRSEVTAHITAEENAALDAEIDTLLATYGISQGGGEDSGEDSGDDGP
jgi:predicted DNA-binding protein (UPF0251 family)